MKLILLKYIRLDINEHLLNFHFSVSILHDTKNLIIYEKNEIIIPKSLFFYGSDYVHSAAYDWQELSEY
jgi:hypothetical protein